MKTQYQNVVELAQAVEAARALKKDVIADTRQLTLQPNGSDLIVPEQGVFPVGEYAHGQIAERLGIPKRYYDKMRTEVPALLADNVNAWFNKTPKRQMIRLLGNRVRAFLSDRYQRIENEEVFAALLPVFQEMPNLQFKSLALTESRMYIKATLPTLRGEVKVGDVVEAGFEIRNGEIGNSRFEVNPFADRLICKNGMRFPVGGYKKLHIGAKADTTEDVYELLSDEALKADDKAFLLKARDVVKASVTETTFHKLLNQMRAATEDRIEGNPVEAVKVLTQTLSLTEVESGMVLRNLINGGDLSRWGVANAVTATAQEVDSYDRSDELEGFGGKIIELPKTEWKELARAA